jgi:spore coat assembly protein
MIKAGDLVVRKSHGKDIIFKVTEVDAARQRCMLKGMHLRLAADAPQNDLEHITAECLKSEAINLERLQQNGLARALDRRKGERRQEGGFRGDRKMGFFELPGRVLHIDGDEEYLNMCMKTYSQLKIRAVGKCIEEMNQPSAVLSLLAEYRPDILILTGHDALLGSGKRDLANINNYRHSRYFAEAVRRARSDTRDLDELVIFAGACQSCFEAILDAGANFASSPQRIFIHAYDPVFIAEKVAFTSIGRIVDVAEAVNASVTGVEGVGGVETRGKLRTGLPKTPYR